MGTCPEAGSRRYGTRILCDTHHQWVLQVRARIATIGYGEHHTPAPDYPPGWAELRCFLCGAGWTGPIGETCGWCEDRIEAQRRGQATLALIEPDVDIDAAPTALTNALEAWRKRLAVAIEAELVTEAQAGEAVNAWLDKLPKDEEKAA
jgi:hypothetical protein